MTQHQPREETSESDWEHSPPKSSKKLRRKKRNNTTIRAESPTNDSVVAITVPIVLSMPGPMRLLVCSIGNPGQYLNTLHSAGHTVLNTLAASLSHPSFSKSRQHGNGLLSEGPRFTLWQSSSMMNISGSGVTAAYRQFLKELRGEEGRLIVVHDELELPLGQVNVKDGGASPKGHNGLKSIKECMRGEKWTRIGVGIGRPESREPDVVARYVLKKMSAVERKGIDGATGRVEAELRKLAG